jgi:enoyl-CoA hydratase/carnithine racemase
MADVILVEKRGHVTIATLNRPERHNAINVAMSAALRNVTADFSEDSNQRVLIITGAGEKAFCAGGDLVRMEDDAAPAKGKGKPVQPVPSVADVGNIAKCEKPVIAAINGLAVGGGMEIALCCDIRIASDKAWFALPEPKRGILAGVACSVLPRMMPIGAVMDLMLGGERMIAADAYRLGLVQALVSPEDLLDEAMKRAERMAKMSQPALWATKASIRYWRDLMLAEQHKNYQAMVHRVLLSGDMMEGFAAFREKREPEFGGGWPEPGNPRP